MVCWKIWKKKGIYTHVFGDCSHRKIAFNMEEKYFENFEKSLNGARNMSWVNGDNSNFMDSQSIVGNL